MVDPKLDITKLQAFAMEPSVKYKIKIFNNIFHCEEIVTIASNDTTLSFVLSQLILRLSQPQEYIE